jgi:hypothetical protein
MILETVCSVAELREAQVKVFKMNSIAQQLPCNLVAIWPAVPPEEVF